ncbi:Mov34/MPN/PAD-1 family protein [Marinobacter gelidimuriae]|uniref:Mov34/MPN/PAD-1 family protein n=1 Tax=Marinobacter gelidimuriae TaxID=2739064 RepID=UPI0003749C67|nr:M67 family metallopeptidase [Marinobacter gelidimuriae]
MSDTPTGPDTPPISPGLILNLPFEVVDALEWAAIGAYPEECCGLLLGHVPAHSGANSHAVSVVKAQPVANSAAPDERRYRYTMHPRQWLAAEREGQVTGLDIVGVFHSHPDGAAAPSGTDLELALPSLAYLIMATDGKCLTGLCGWYLATAGRRFLKARVTT